MHNPGTWGGVYYGTLMGLVDIYLAIIIHNRLTLSTP